MIISKIYSGLGNQMFQYATGKATALRLNTDLKLDLSWFDISEKMVRAKRQFELNNFPNIHIDLANEKKCRQIGYIDDFGFALLGKLRRRLHSCYKQLFTKKSYVTDKNDNIELLQTGLDHYLDGYWQSEIYFKDFADQITSSFSFPRFQNEKNISLATELLKRDDTIAIHVRRGDYVLSPKDYKVFGGICTIEYYKQAVAVMEKLLRHPSYVVFSDEPQWAAENLNLPQTTIFVDWNNHENSFRDMQLMTCCKHNIIANSSFSWWGAWLNQNPDKIVIAPARWTNDNSINTEHCLPDEWLKI